MVKLPQFPRKPEPVDRGRSESASSATGASRRFPFEFADSSSVSGRSHPLASAAFELIVAEFTERYERGEAIAAEDYVDRLGSDHPADLVELIYHEFCLAEALGQNPDPSDFLRRFPAQGEPLERLFRLHGAFRSSELRGLIEPTPLPEVGDEIGPYLLRRELGRGSFARVFLAEQADLDRLVVLKISTRLTSEPRLLARARHSHIVEVLWHGSAEDGALQLIGMPFLGGATLAMVLAERIRLRRRPRSGRDLLGDLDQVSAPEYPKANLARPAREIVERLSYPAALAWMVARLAEALDHAFERGVAHGDIKPSNILLSADGNPMLLDFNLAVGWLLPGASDLPPDAGGTLAYMAPERLRAVAAGRRASIPGPAERHRADIFALGIVLLEALTCRAPDLRQAKARNRQEIAALLDQSAEQGGEAMRWLARSTIPGSLRPILQRCLASDPADRYRRAAELAEDLDRWRTDRPLAFAAEPPARFRLARWGRRRRYALTAAVLALAVGIGAALLAWNALEGSLREQARDKLALIWDRDESGAFRFHRFGHSRPEEQGDPAAQALRQLDRYDVVANPDWRLRDDIRHLPEPDRSDLEVWLLEQIFRYARALADRPDSRDDWQRGRALLARTIAQTPLGALETLHRSLCRKLHLPDPPPASASASGSAEPPRWMDEYLLGVEAEPDRARDALGHYRRVLKERPDCFWGHYRAATVAYRLGDHAAAAEHLGRCIARRPDNPALRAQRAACLFELGKYDAALEECNQALTIDPDHATSTRTRTFIRGRLGQVDSLEDDLRRFELLTRSVGEAFALRFRLDSMLPRSPQTLPAPFVPELPLARTPDEGPDDIAADARILRAARLRDEGRTDDALLELDKVLALDPTHLQARYYRAMLLRKLKRPEAEQDFAALLAHPRFEELLPQYPDAVNVYHQRVRDHLRAGRNAEAIEVARQGLLQSNRFQALRGQSHYTLARAYAASAKSRARSSLIEQVVAELGEARRLDPEQTLRWFEHDPYFDALRARIRPLLVDHP
jgi:serine/threonine protein kinase/Tfp pilus assembly protein PilF